ncbi:uncharacterized protein LOC115624250 [Scaptodrosophila lebanonensis]|uniref:Uncharacterized protein LOC115624250 n=1 Tax=Drosophila lebanonensis TaxID=7225 RepID=A0A6J2TH04_DROLE|nr:uncharacterized protein LOC115624250 [Scaptodrosophila lebanonensis]
MFSTNHEASSEFPFLDRVRDWSKEHDIMSIDMTRIIALMLFFIIVCYTIVLVARLCMTIALPSFVVLVIIFLCRYIHENKLANGLAAIAEAFLSLVQKCFEVVS